MDKLLITTTELAEMLSMGKRKARKFCEENGIYPIKSGGQNRARLLWHVKSVTDMVGTLHAKSKPRQPSSSSSKCVRHKILGRNLDELMNELNVSVQEG